MHIWGIALVVVGVLNLIRCYFLATDKLKLRKSNLITYDIFVSLWLFTCALKYF